MDIVCSLLWSRRIRGVGQLPAFRKGEGLEHNAFRGVFVEHVLALDIGVYVTTALNVALGGGGAQDNWGWLISQV